MHPWSQSKHSASILILHNQIASVMKRQGWLVEVLILRHRNDLLQAFWWCPRARCLVKSSSSTKGIYLSTLFLERLERMPKQVALKRLFE